LRNQIPQIDAYDLTNLRNAVANQRTRLVNQSAVLDARRDLDSRLVPEFASGGWTGGGGLARLHANEAVINQSQMAQLGAMMLGAAGVPDMPTGSIRGGSLAGGPEIIVNYTLGTESQDQIFISGARSRNTNNAFKDKLKTVVRYG
jgi:hypothetical protein